MHQKRAGVHTANATESPHWQDGMQSHGGRVLHMTARAGWVVFGLLGGLFMFVVTVLFMFFDDDDTATPLEKLLGGLIVFVPIGVLLFGLLGLGVQAGARAWLRSAPARTSAAEEKAQALTDRVEEAGVRPASRWEEHYERCVRSVLSYHDIVADLPAGAAKNWFEEVGQSLDAQLTEALQLARLGDSLEEGSDPDTGLNAAGARADEQLAAAATSFEHTAERAGEIVLDLRDESDFTRVQAQLDMLAEQTPQLQAENRR